MIALVSLLSMPILGNLLAAMLPFAIDSDVHQNTQIGKRSRFAFAARPRLRPVEHGRPAPLNIGHTKTAVLYRLHLLHESHDLKASKITSHVRRRVLAFRFAEAVFQKHSQRGEFVYHYLRCVIGLLPLCKPRRRRMVLA